MKKIFGLGSVIVLSTVATMANAQNLLTNGSFEIFRGNNSVTQASITGAIGTGLGSGIAGGTGLGSSVNRVTVGAAGSTNTSDLDGWKITAGYRQTNGTFTGTGLGFGIEVVGSSWSYTGNSGALTNNGYQSVSLAGLGGSMISQSVSVVAGQRYSLDYWYAAEASNFYNNAGVAAARNSFYDVVIDGVVVSNDVSVATGSYVNNANVTVARTQGNMGWKFQHLEWVSNKTGTVDIGFAMQGLTDRGIALDNVSFQAIVPEPGTFALAGFGLLPLGYMIRRRRNNDTE